jgi:hypothetical protein
VDPYIINNMPDDEPLVADLELVAEDVKVAVCHDGDSYVMIAGPVDAAEGSVIAAFDPTCTLEVVLSFLAIIRQATVVGGSPEANAIATAIKAAQDVADLD